MPNYLVFAVVLIVCAPLPSSYAQTAVVQTHAEITVHPEESQTAGIPPIELGHATLERVAVPGGSSAMGALVMSSSPGVAADSNGTFHPLGEHAEVSYLLDEELVTDQQAPPFAIQVPLLAVGTIEIHQGTPAADVGDKTSMIVVLHAKSGFDDRNRSGQLEVSGGSYRSLLVGAGYGLRGRAWAGYFAGEGLVTKRFLDTPERTPLHAGGGSGNGFSRVDWRADAGVAAHMDLQWARTQFETPNTYDQQAAGQSQRQHNSTWRVAPVLDRAFTEKLDAVFAGWVRRDTVRYLPSSNLYADSPATLSQNRTMLHAGLRTAWSWTRGAQTLRFGADYRSTLLQEQFATAITDAAYNSPCLGTDGAPSADVALRDAGQCAGAGLDTNPEFLPGLLSIDLTRGGQMFDFSGHADVRQTAAYVEETLQLRRVTIAAGLRGELYRGLTRSGALQPRASMAWRPWRDRLGVHVGYARVLLTPYNENLIVASSQTPGSLGAEPLQTARRNQFHAGMTSAMGKRITVSADYFWKFTRGAYDFDVLLNSPLAFPTQFRKAKIDGGMVRVALLESRGWSGFVTVSHVRSRLFGPAVGGLQFSAPYGNVVRPDHDEGLAVNATVRKQLGRRGPWFAASYRYDGGLVAVAVPDAASALRLSGDEQQQMGLHCSTVYATIEAPIRSCGAGFGATRIRIPAAGTEDDDRHPPRIAVRNVVDVSVGQDAIWGDRHGRVGAQVTVTNVGNVDGLYNFLSTFAGTHFLAGRVVQGKLQWHF